MAARSYDKLLELAPSVNSDPERILCVKTDVTKEEDCRNLIDETVKKFGRIDILVNNAGISMRAMFKDLDLSVIRSLMDVNFWGTVQCTKYALPYLLESKGQVVGVISIAGFSALPARTGYCLRIFARSTTVYSFWLMPRTIICQRRCKFLWMQVRLLDASMRHCSNNMMILRPKRCAG